MGNSIVKDKEQTNNSVIMAVDIEGEKDTFSVALRYADDFFISEEGQYTKEGAIHLAFDDSVRLSESLRLLFNEANISYVNASKVTVRYMKNGDEFFVSCLGLEANKKILSGSHKNNLDFLINVFKEQSQVTLDYIKCYWESLQKNKRMEDLC